MELLKHSNRRLECFAYPLMMFDKYLTQIKLDSKEITYNIIDSWFESMEIKQITKQSRLNIIRGFIKYLRSIKIDSDLPDYISASSNYVPYIFTDDEFEKIINISDNLISPTKKCSLQYYQFPFLIRLLYGCGLRLGEALALQWKDIDNNNGIITIQNSKNLTQRLTPMSNSLNEIFQHYRRSGICGINETDYLFAKPNELPFTKTSFKRMFNRVLALSGINIKRYDRHERGPCLHCFRHLFVTKSFLKAQSEGKNFNDYIPFLSTYLGHSNIMGTNKYFNSNYNLHIDSHKKINDYLDGVFPKGR
jgi:integrase